jgi:hypothetical protein
MSVNEYEVPPEQQLVSDAVGSALSERLTKKPIEERLDALAMAQVFSFWREVQDAMQEAAAEIRKLKEESD